MNFSQWTVKAKLVWAFGSLTTVVCIVSVLAISLLGQAHNRFEGFVNGASQQMQLAADVRGAVLRRAVAARNLVLTTSAQDQETEKQAVQQAHSDVQKRLDTLVSMVRDTQNESAQGQKLVADIERIEGMYGPVATRIVGMALDGKRDEAIASMNADCRPLLNDLTKATTTYIEFLQASADEQVKVAEASYEFQRALLLGASALAIAMAIAAGYLITRSLLRALGADPALLGAAAERVAQGDLFPIDGASAAQTGSVLASLGTMQANLANVVGQVRSASDSIATGSAQIAVGNADLSQRTEEQASNLQQTAASMEQLTGTVRNNAETAQQADQLATTASDAAIKGGEVVEQVIGTMEEIAASSKKISDIIGVIDGIAFQTNILALNAAVEAARAGEQGRGFAVVAGEVRTLAQRSANAAKEIKALIVDSVEKVSVGTRQVNEAGESMSAIVTQVKHVSDLIGEISRATSEQTNGISQVSDAVNQLDQVTQQNAALVEESAAAADSLRQQADRLTKVVSVFKLQNGEHIETKAAAAPKVQNQRSSFKPVSKTKVAPVAAPVATSTAKPNPEKADLETEWDTF